MTLLSDVVKLADSITNALAMQAQNVSWKRFVSDGGIGDPVEKTTKSLRAVVEKKHRLVRSADGEEKISHTSFLFLKKISISEGDRLFLSDGSGGVVIAVESPVDRSGTLITQAYL